MIQEEALISDNNVITWRDKMSELNMDFDFSLMSIVMFGAYDAWEESDGKRCSWFEQRRDEMRAAHLAHTDAQFRAVNKNICDLLNLIGDKV